MCGPTLGAKILSATLLTTVFADSPVPRKFVAVERSEEDALLALSEFSGTRAGARHDRSCHEKSRDLDTTVINGALGDRHGRGAKKLTKPVL